MKKVYLALYKGHNDTWGVFATVLPLKGNRTRWFCSEWCAMALGLQQPEKYSPNSLAKLFQGV